MNQLQRCIVWLKRIGHCCGFGIHSPADYAFVRYVLNEHWPYYAYERGDLRGSWLQRKLGRLYLRLANWRQPSAMLADEYEEWWRAGCRSIRFEEQLPEHVELARAAIEQRDMLGRILNAADSRSAVVVEGIWRDMAAWRSLINDERVTVSFDLYYCGILLFADNRHKKNYIVNF